ncbi:MAG: hypothetical protein A2X48_10455 [Lentisphaerae bacterium GWF2_49_21]|nr:MAG: hypothetical protein A2X48_10455 [Lentisphaerae bacterium GWF2_49_21]
MENAKPVRALAFAAVSLIMTICGCSAGPEKSASPETPAVKVQHREFLFGADFNPKAPDNIKNLFYETGMNCIRMTGGGYSWAADMHKKIADEFEARGLKVYMQLGSHYPSADYFQFKDAWFVDQDGKTGVEDRNAWSISYGNDHWPQYSYTSDKTKAKFTQDFKKYVDVFSKNRNIAGVILHNEPGFFWQNDRLFDYNPATIEKYRTWLEGRYPTIGDLNSQWKGTSANGVVSDSKNAYAKFADITPPGKPPVQNIAAWLEWRRFSVETIADFMKWESELSSSLRKALPRTTNMDGPLTHWYGYRCADNQAYSKAMDNAGIDIYPTEWTDRDFVPYSMDMLMGVAQNREGHVLECDIFSSKLWKNLSETQRARLLTAELWSFIGHGASCILVWGFDRGDNFNLTSGEFNERVLVCRDIAHYTKMIGIGSFARRPSQVAVCVDPDSYLYLSGLEKKPHQDTSALDSENHGVHAALLSAGIQSDVIFTAQLRDEAAKKYKALVLPSAMMMDPEIAETLKEYVLAGGMVIADAPFAIMDRWGKPSDYKPNSGLNQHFGIDYDNKGEALTSGVINTPQGKIPVAPPIENLTLLSAKVLGTLENGKPGLTSKTTGKGTAVFFTGRVGTAYMNNPEGNALGDSLKCILSSVPPFIEVSPVGARKLDCSSLEDANGNLLIVAATQGAKGKMSEEIKDVKIGIPCENPTTFRSAFILQPTKNDNGIVRSGPEAVKISTDAKKLSISIGDVVSATQLLLAKDMGPLLSAEALSLLKKGQEAEIKITCHNPSSKKLDGALHLKLPAGFSEIGGKTKISVEPYGQQAVVLKFKVDSDKAIDRAPISAVLTSASVPAGIPSVPVDVKVE